MQPIPHPEPQPGTGLPGVGALFGGFFSIGICGFGGTLPWARRMVVEQRGWLAASEFTDLLALCQFLPGPNIVNFAVCLGARFRGLAAAASGLVLATALQIAAPLRGRALGLAVAGVALLAIAVLRLPLLPTMLVLAPLSVALHRTPR